MMRESILVGVMAAFAGAAQAQQLFQIPYVAGSQFRPGSPVLSPDGSTLVTAWQGDVYRWTIGDPEWELVPGLQDVTVTGASNSAEFLVGGKLDPVGGGATGFRYSEALGLEFLSTPTPGVFTAAVAVSCDGQTVIGTDYVWTPSTGMQPLIPPPNRGVYATEISCSGRAVIGMTSLTGTNRLLRWVDGGPAEELPRLNNFSRSHRAADVSDDGTFIVGYQMQGFRWEELFGQELLPFLGGADVAKPRAVSADGEVVTGHVETHSSGVYPFIWDDIRGLRSLVDEFVRWGVDIRTWNLIHIEAMSRNARVFVIWARYAGENQSCVVDLDACYADCDNNQRLDAFDFLCFQDAFFIGEYYADCDQSTGIGIFDMHDMLCYQNAFIRGCQ